MLLLQGLPVGAFLAVFTPADIVNARLSRCTGARRSISVGGRSLLSCAKEKSGAYKLLHRPAREEKTREWRGARPRLPGRVSGWDAPGSPRAPGRDWRGRVTGAAGVMGARGAHIAPRLG